MWYTRFVLCTLYGFVGAFLDTLLGREQTFLQSYVQFIAFSEVAMEWQARAVLPLLLLSLPFSQPGAVQFDPSTIDSTIANYEFVFVNFYADWYVMRFPLLQHGIRMTMHFSFMPFGT